MLGNIIRSVEVGESEYREISIGIEPTGGAGAVVERNESKSSGVKGGVWVRIGSGNDSGEAVGALLLLFVPPECGEKQLRRRVARSTYCLKIWKIGPSCLG